MALPVRLGLAGPPGSPAACSGSVNRSRLPPMPVCTRSPQPAALRRPPLPELRLGPPAASSHSLPEAPGVGASRPGRPQVRHGTRAPLQSSAHPTGTWAWGGRRDGPSPGGSGCQCYLCTALLESTRPHAAQRPRNKFPSPVTQYVHVRDRTQRPPGTGTRRGARGHRAGRSGAESQAGGAGRPRAP